MIVMVKSKTNELKKMNSRYAGKGARRCRFCKSAVALVRKYGLNICRRCFKERAPDIGFKKF